jgi:hypothetical protein
MPCPKCNSDLEIIFNIGWDISGDGEEKQHLQRCKSCKEWRFYTEYLDYDELHKGWTKHYGKWHSKEETVYGL